LDVIVLDDAEEIQASSRASRRKPTWISKWLDRKPWRAWSGAAIATIVVHVVFVGSLTLGTGKRAARPPENEGFQSLGHNRDGTELVSVLFFVNDKSIRTPEEGNESAYMPADVQQLSVKDSAAVASTVVGAAGKPPSLEDFDASAAATQDADGDGGEAALLFGRYMGQIKARIERAWEYAGSPSRRRSQCRVQIRQSVKGEVQDISVQRCDLDPEGQLSLVRAIQAASPLSAPPSEKVFTEVVTLTFTAAPQIANSVDSSSPDSRRAMRLN
jgi:hypothetical protein